MDTPHDWDNRFSNTNDGRYWFSAINHKKWSHLSKNHGRRQKCVVQMRPQFREVRLCLLWKFWTLAKTETAFQNLNLFDRCFAWFDTNDTDTNIAPCLWLTQTKFLCHYFQPKTANHDTPTALAEQWLHWKPTTFYHAFEPKCCLKVNKPNFCPHQ